LPAPALKGEFQFSNAATVIAGLKSIAKVLPVSIESIEKGLKNTTIMGRLQLIQSSPDWLIDVAHNPHSALALAKYLDKKPSTGKTFALFSMLKDKDIKQVLSIMDRHIDEWHIVGLEGSRGMTTANLSLIMKSANIQSKIIPHKSFLDAIHFLKKDSKNKDKVVVFGSFLVVSNVIESWGS
jgi:dihydrofolate synthase/folylpolyglutamate synthase